MQLKMSSQSEVVPVRLSYADKRDDFISLSKFNKEIEDRLSWDGNSENKVTQLRKPKTQAIKPSQQILNTGEALHKIS